MHRIVAGSGACIAPANIRKGRALAFGAARTYFVRCTVSDMKGGDVIVLLALGVLVNAQGAQPIRSGAFQKSSIHLSSGSPFL